MTFKEDWQNSWEREWDVTQSSTGWWLTDTDFVTFKGIWNDRGQLVEVKIQRISQGGVTEWLDKCTYDDSGGGQVRGMISDMPFTITRIPAASGTKAKLECLLATSDRRAGSRFRALPLSWLIRSFVAQFILRPAAAALIDVADRLAPHSGGRTGSWTAEDGGTNFHMEASPFEVRPHGGMRRRA